MIRRVHLIAVVALLIGCAVVLMAGASGVQAEASKKEEARCEGTRTIKESGSGEIYTTNDIPGCPKGGLLLGTEGSDRTEARRDPARPSLYGRDGDDVIRGLGGSDTISHGYGDDVIYGVTVTMGCSQTVAKTSSMVGLATMILIPTMMGGTSSIAVLAGTNTLLTRTTMWIAVARRIPAPGPSHRGTRGTTLLCLRLRPAPSRFRQVVVLPSFCRLPRCYSRCFSGRASSPTRSLGVGEPHELRRNSDRRSSRRKPIAPVRSAQEQPSSRAHPMGIMRKQGKSR